MKAIALFVCAIILFTSCQKEIFLPETAQTDPTEVNVPTEPQPEPEPAPEPEPEPEDPNLDPAPGEISESVYLRNLRFFLNSDFHYKISRVYTDKMNLWLTRPEWSKDDIHTFGNAGSGVIESVVMDYPANPFKHLNQKWTAYAEEDGIKLSWVDDNYHPVTYTLVYAVPGKCFKAFHVVDGIKIFVMFTIV